MRDMIRQFTGVIAGQVSGREMAIEIEEISPPLVNDMKQQFHGGGMPGPVQVPLGVELTEARIKMATWNADVLRTMMRAAGTRDTITLRGVTTSEVDGTTKPILMVTEGRMSEADPDVFQRGERSGIDFTIDSIVYYKLVMNERLIYEIDFLNMIQNRGGVDEYAEIRAALGFQ